MNDSVEQITFNNDGTMEVSISAVIALLLIFLILLVSKCFKAAAKIYEIYQKKKPDTNV